MQRGPTPAAHLPKNAPGEIRIVGGAYKRTKLAVPAKLGLRPTPDRVRETLFNWLGQDLSGWRCLDAFAGTGALGLECASRGAVEVLMVERDSTLTKAIEQHIVRLGASQCAVRAGDGIATLAAQAAKWDLVLIDPPFDGHLFEGALKAAAKAVIPNGWVYLEAPTAYGEEALAALGFELYRHLKAGLVHAHLLKRT
jgi:16S rRNA (guanine(966)-N(2))-methyltransferase RsmD